MIVHELSLPALFIAGLATSPHCGLMCGPLQAWQLRGSRAGSAAPAWVHGGRVLGYSALGGAAGALGAQGLNYLPLERYGGWIQFAAALMLIVLGVRYWRQAPSCHLRAQTRAGTPRVAPGAGRLLARGLAWAMLPCAALYATLFLAALSANAAYGALLLAAFGLGTVPLLAGGGALLSALGRPQRLRRVAAVALLSLGAVSALAIPTMAGSAAWCRPAETVR